MWDELQKQISEGKLLEAVARKPASGGLNLGLGNVGHRKTTANAENNCIWTRKNRWKQNQLAQACVTFTWSTCCCCNKGASSRYRLSLDVPKFQLSVSIRCNWERAWLWVTYVGKQGCPNGGTAKRSWGFGLVLFKLNNAELIKFW